MKFKIQIAMCILLCIFIFTLLCACGPSLEFQMKKEQGLYPDTSDFPNTKWVCNELDMSLYMFDYGETTIIGSYVINDISYRVEAWFDFSCLNFNFYSDTLISTSEYSDSMVHCEQVLQGYIYTEYSFMYMQIR